MEGPVNVVSYLVQMREKLQKMSHLAEAHMAAAQQHQKAWYDKLAQQRRFESGQKVLVKLPTSDSMLLVNLAYLHLWPLALIWDISQENGRLK